MDLVDFCILQIDEICLFQADRQGTRGSRSSFRAIRSRREDVQQPKSRVVSEIFRTLRCLPHWPTCLLGNVLLFLRQAKHEFFCGRMEHLFGENKMEDTGHFEATRGPSQLLSGSS